MLVSSVLRQKKHVCRILIGVTKENNSNGLMKPNRSDILEFMYALIWIRLHISKQLRNHVYTHITEGYTTDTSHLNNV